MFDFIILLKALLVVIAVTAFCYWQIKDVESAKRAKRSDRD